MSQADKVLKMIEEMADKESLPILGPKKGKVLVNVLREVGPTWILEIGTLIGYSAILMSKELGNDAQIIAIEIDEDEAKIAKDNIKIAKIKPKIVVIVGDALKVLPKLEGEFDFH